MTDPSARSEKASTEASEPVEGSTRVNPLTAAATITGGASRWDTSGAVALTWTVLTVLALTLSYLLPHLGVIHRAMPVAVWGAYNLIGWAVTLRALRRSRTGSSASRQVLETLAVATIAVWAVVAVSSASTALAEWATLPVIQIVIGVSLVSIGATVRDGMTTLFGLVLVVSAPVLLTLGEQADPGLWSLLMMIAGIVLALVTISLAWRRHRIATKYRTDA